MRLVKRKARKTITVSYNTWMKLLKMKGRTGETFDKIIRKALK